MVDLLSLVPEAARTALAQWLAQRGEPSLLHLLRLLDADAALHGPSLRRRHLQFLVAPDRLVGLCNDEHQLASLRGGLEDGQGEPWCSEEGDPHRRARNLAKALLS